MKRVLTIVAALTVLIAGMAAAQNLLDNDAYKKALQLRDAAQQALANGDYAGAQQLSQQAADAAKQALETAQAQALAYRASNWLDIAKGRIQYGNSINASNGYPDLWSKAEDQMTTAQSTFDAKQYDQSIAASQAVVDALRNIQPTTPKPIPVVAAALPRYYTVRLIPDLRDCFWRIAGYPFVYGDPLKWPLLYQANKQVLQDPSNPDLIQPGMVFTIPSVNGESRDGTWKP